MMNKLLPVITISQNKIIMTLESLCIPYIIVHAFLYYILHMECGLERGLTIWNTKVNIQIWITCGILNMEYLWNTKYGILMGY